MTADAGLPGSPAGGASAPQPEPATPPPLSTPAPQGRPPGPGWKQVPGPRAPVSAAGERNWLVAAVARGLALFIGVFTLLSTVGAARSAAFGDFDANVWWVAVPYVPRLAGALLLAVVGIAFVTYALAPRMPAWRRWPTVGLFLFFAAAAASDAVRFFLAWRAGDIRPGVPFPLSLVVAALLVFVAWAAMRDAARRSWPSAGAIVLTALVAALAFPLAQVVFFGTTDYRRPADVAVVFGAQVHPGGRPSTSLKDRMTTAVQLWKDHLVKQLVVSGGVGDSGYNEALVMRDMAVKAGVPSKDVIVDSNGVNTEATVNDTMPFFGTGSSAHRVLAVSQFYHLPRIKLAYQRAGLNVFTVPAGTSTPIPQTPQLVAREIPAFWVYYLRAVFG